MLTFRHHMTKFRNVIPSLVEGVNNFFRVKNKINIFKDVDYEPTGEHERGRKLPPHQHY